MSQSSEFFESGQVFYESRDESGAGAPVAQSKLIPDMTHEELTQMLKFYGPEHRRTAKLAKEIARRAQVAVSSLANPVLKVPKELLPFMSEAELTEVSRKFIPDMTAIELKHMQQFYDPSHKRAPKITSEIEKREQAFARRELTEAPSSRGVVLEQPLAPVEGSPAAATVLPVEVSAEAPESDLTVTLGGTNYPVESIADAQTKWAEFRELSGKRGAVTTPLAVATVQSGWVVLGSIGLDGLFSAYGKEVPTEEPAVFSSTAPEHLNNTGKALQRDVKYDRSAQALVPLTSEAPVDESLVPISLNAADFKEIADEWAALFADPEGGTLRLADKAKASPTLTVIEAKAKIAEWKAHTAKQFEESRGENSGKTVLSLFDLTGEWSRPWEEAGYQVIRFDIQTGQDVNDFSVEYFTENYGLTDVYAILAATPCTDFASSGARHFAAKDADGRTEASKELVFKTMQTIEYFRPTVWVLENPVGRIANLTGLPKARLSFDPNHVGDPYTKKTMLWGNFNEDLPVAPVEPTEGSKMWSKYGGKSLATKNARSATPEGFAYAFFMANNYIDLPLEYKLTKQYPEASGAVKQALKAGIPEAEIHALMGETYDNYEYEDARNALIKAVAARIPEPAPIEPQTTVPAVPVYLDTKEADGPRLDAQGVQLPGNPPLEPAQPEPNVLAGAGQPVLATPTPGRQRAPEVTSESARRASYNFEGDTVFVLEGATKGEFFVTVMGERYGKFLMDDAGLITRRTARAEWAKDVVRFASEQFSNEYAPKAPPAIAVDVISAPVGSINDSPVRAGDVFLYGAGEAATVVRTLPGGKAEVRIQGTNLRVGETRVSNLKKLERIGRAEYLDGFYYTPPALIELAKAKNIHGAQPTGVAMGAMPQKSVVEQAIGLTVSFGGKNYPVDSISDAQDKWVAFRDSAGAGVSEIGNGVRVTDSNGKLVARISYNGRAWDSDKDNANLMAEAPEGRTPMPEGVNAVTAQGYIPPRETLEQVTARANQLAAQSIQAPVATFLENAQGATVVKDKTPIQKLAEPPFLGYRVQKAAINSVRLFPPVSKSFTAEQIQQLREWVSAAGFSAFAKGSGVYVIGEDAPDIPGGLQIKRMSKESDLEKARADAKSTAEANRAAEYQVLPASQWIEATLGADFANPYNKLQLARYLDGGKFEGLTNSSWFAPLERMGFDTSDQVMPVSSVLEFLLMRYRESNVPVPKVETVSAARADDQAFTGDPVTTAFDGMDKLIDDLNTGDENATQQLDQSGTGALAGASAEYVRPSGGGEDAGVNSDGGRDGNVGTDAGADRGGDQSAGRLGAGEGTVPVSSGGAGADAGNGAQSGLPGARGVDEGVGFAGVVGGGLVQELALDIPPVEVITLAPQFMTEDFVITDELELGAGGQKAKFKGNIAAIKLLAELDDANRMATPDEQMVLAKYVGWGGLAQAFDDDHSSWTREHMELRSLLSPEDFDAARKSTRYAYYTSREIIAEGVYAAMTRFGFTGGKTLEAGAGVGNFIGLMPPEMRSAGRFTAIEREPFAVAIAKHLYPRQSIQVADFTEFRGSDAYYDAVVGNPPFASDSQVDMSGRKHLSGLSLHNYFFAKGIDMLREGGIMAQVVTSSFLDAAGDKARKYISDRAKLLGAIRLPNDAFSKNAGTEVTTDIIFLQKRPDAEIGGKAAREDAKRWLNTGKYDDARGYGPKLDLNQYFIDNPDMMLGDFGGYGTMYGHGKPALMARPGQDTLALLKAAVGKLPANVYKSIGNTAATSADLIEAVITALENPTVKEGGYFVQDDKLMQRLPDLGGEARAVEISATTQWTAKTTLGEPGVDRIKALAGLRSTMRGLIAAEMGNDEMGMQVLRLALNRQYDDYRAKYGMLNDPGTIRVFDDDPDFPLLASLEHSYKPGIGAAAAKRMGVKETASSATKSPIFSQRVVAARAAIQKVETAADALAVSMAERGRLDATYIGELLGQEPEDVLRELRSGDNPLLFGDPSTDEYVLRDAYLSGNVRLKLKQAKEAGMFANIRALEAVQPVDVSSHEIVGRLGAPWIPTKVYEDFAKELFGKDSKANVFYMPLNSSFQVTVSGASEAVLANQWGTPRYRGNDMLQALMNNRVIKVTYVDEQKKVRTDMEATDQANLKAQEIKDRFSDWLFSDPERSEILTRTYNDTNNNYVTRVYDGSNMTFPGKVPDSIIKHRRHQRDGVARIVQDRTALLDHVVGSGKTYSVITAAMELKRTGLATKSMVAVPNHLVKQWAADFYRLYPGANILTATKKDFEKVNRRKFLARIATGDWDAVVIAHSSFGFIRPSPEFEIAFNFREVDKVIETITSVKNEDIEGGSKRRTVKQLEGIKEKLENRIKSLRDKPMDDLLDFGQLGVNQLFVDEAHLFKNLMYTTKMQQVQGLGDGAGSQRAYDMYIKCNQIMAMNGRDQGVVFATGTPISNSLAEMYHMMRYLMPTTMADMGFSSFDAWANTYASVEQVWMQAPSGDGFKVSNRMSNFVNTPELLKIFDQVCDTVTMEEIKRAYSEENDGAEFPIPKLKGGRRTPVSMLKSQAQEAYMASIAKRAKELETRGGRAEKGGDNILVIMGDARKCAMDIRLVDLTVTEREKGGRIDVATDLAVERYHQFAEVKGTQVIFSDLGTPLKHAKAELKEYEALQLRIEAGTEDVVGSASLGNERSMAIMEDVEAAQAELAAKGGDWLGAVQSALRGFSVYDDYKAALIEKGIPESEIAFVHDYNTDEQKASLFRKMNSGEMRFLLGSTAKLGAGTNVQERLVSEQHLDVPWRPSDVEQREGRIIRQGNLLMSLIPDFEVEVLAFVTKDTLDMRMWQTQEVKLKMINQLRTRQVGREVDNAFEDMELSAGEMQAAATGDINLLKEIQLRTDIKKLEQKRRSFEAQSNDLTNRKKRAAEQVDQLPAKLLAATAEAVHVNAYFQDLNSTRPAFEMTIDGEQYTDPLAAKAYFSEKDRATIELKGVAGSTTTKAAPIRVEINGEVVTSRALMGEIYSEAVGDRELIKWVFNGETYRRRSKIATAILQNTQDCVSRETLKQVGTFGAYSVAVEGSSVGNRNTSLVEVTLRREGAVVMSQSFGVESSTGAAERVIRAVESMVCRAQEEVGYLTNSLQKAEKEHKALKLMQDLGKWPDEGRLVAARQAHLEVLGRLKQKTAPKPGDAAAEATLNAQQSGDNKSVKVTPTIAYNQLSD